MNLLNATTRYYLLLALLLLVGGSLGLYYGIDWALRTEVSEQLADRRVDKVFVGQAAERCHLATARLRAARRHIRGLVPVQH